MKPSSKEINEAKIIRREYYLAKQKLVDWENNLKKAPSELHEKHRVILDEEWNKLNKWKEEVLNKLPHIPNKKERKTIRQNLSKF